MWFRGYFHVTVAIAIFIHIDVAQNLRVQSERHESRHWLVVAQGEGLTLCDESIVVAFTMTHTTTIAVETDACEK